MVAKLGIVEHLVIGTTANELIAHSRRHPRDHSQSEVTSNPKGYHWLPHSREAHEYCRSQMASQVSDVSDLRRNWSNRYWLYRVYPESDRCKDIMGNVGVWGYVLNLCCVDNLVVVGRVEAGE